jgi:hypothetical protein
MGADLITYICVGPKKIKLSETRRRSLVGRAMSRRKKVLAAAGRGLAEARGLSLEKLQRSDSYECWLEDFLRNECDGEEILVNVTPKDVRTTLVQLVDLWNGGNVARDQSYRFWKNRRIVVAGEMSWGDEPEGYGYQLLKRARAMGLLDALGIE